MPELNLDPELLAILACPLEDSRPPLRLEDEHLICDSCKMAFPVKEGIPQLLPEDAVELSAIQTS